MDQDGFRISERDESSSMESFINPVSSKKTYGPATQKLRETICKHFLSKSLEELEQMDYQSISMNTFVLMANLSKCIDQILTIKWTTRKHDTIGIMYNKLDENLYENKFLQKLLANSPAF